MNELMNCFKALNSTMANVDEDIEKLSYQPQNKINVTGACNKNMPVMLIKSNKIKLKTLEIVEGSKVMLSINN